MRRILVIFTGTIVLLAAGYAAAWYYVSDMIQSRLEGWLIDQRRHGVFASYESFERSGFPTSIRMLASQPTVEGPDGFHWEGEGMEVHANRWWRRDVDVRLLGQHTVTTETPFPVMVTTGEGDGSFHVGWDGRIPAASMVLSDVLIDASAAPGPYGRIGDISIANLAMLVEHADLTSDGLTDLHGHFEASSIQMDEPLLEGLEALIERAGAAITVTGPIPREITGASVGEWRDQGGNVRVERLHTTWGDLSLEASGDLTLDAMMQPRGRIDVSARGLQTLVDALEEDGRLSGRQSTLIRAGLQLLGGEPDEEGRRAVEAPLTIREGSVSLGPVPIAELPHIEWP